MNVAVHSVLAASEPSKVPFYVMGGVLVAWAVVLSLIGLRSPEFPGSAGRTRAVLGISALLVVGTVTSAVLTSSKPHEESHAEAAVPPAVDTTQAPPASGGGGGAGATVQVTADAGQLKYEQTSLTAQAGKVTIDFDNPSPIDHDVTITDGKGKLGGTKTVANGKTTAVVDLKPGDYTFYCSVDGHRQAGMEGKLTVK